MTAYGKHTILALVVAAMATPMIMLGGVVCFPIAGTILGLGAWTPDDVQYRGISGGSEEQRIPLIPFLDVGMRAILIAVLSAGLFVGAAFVVPGDNHRVLIGDWLILSAAVFISAVVTGVAGLYESRRTVRVIAGLAVSMVLCVAAYVAWVAGVCLRFSDRSSVGFAVGGVWTLGPLALLPVLFVVVMVRARSMCCGSVCRSRTVFFLGCVVVLLVYGLLLWVYDAKWH